MNIDSAIELLQAAKAGKELEYKMSSSSTEWYPLKITGDNDQLYLSLHGTWQWRVKPAPVEVRLWRPTNGRQGWNVVNEDVSLSSRHEVITVRQVME